MGRIISLFFGIIFLGAIIAAIVGGYFINQFYFISPDDDSIKYFTIEQGENVSGIADRLAEQDFISNAFAFRLYAKWTGTDRDFQTGVFELRPGVSMAALATALTSPDVGVTRATIIEGWTLDDIAILFEDKEMIQSVEIFEQTGIQALDYRPISSVNPSDKWKEDFDFLADKPRDVSLDGYLFPDTYYFFNDASAEEVVDRMLKNFDAKLKHEWRDEINRQGKTIFEIVTMASIIEKEMYGLEARKMVSDIFWKRLEIGMALQSDASVNYVTGKGTTRPSIEDTKVDSPYNTYKHPGLPLGPISNPGAEAIEAAIYPTSNEYYFFLTTPEGEIIYSKNHDEHVANKQKYLR